MAKIDFSNRRARQRRKMYGKMRSTFRRLESPVAMSKEHKEALAQGRLEARSIKAYLSALEEKRPGRPVTKESLSKRLERVEAKLGDEADPLKRLDLLQAKLDIESTLASTQDSASLEELTEGFVAYAKSYSKRKGITYTTWRQYGVPAEVLRNAGVPQTRRHYITTESSSTTRPDSNATQIIATEPGQPRTHRTPFQ